MRVSVILNDTDSQRFNAYCEKHGYKKSTLICRLIREHMENENFTFQPELKFRNQNSRKKGT